MRFKTFLAGASMLGCAGVADAATITVATVNNGDMIIMQKLSPQWEQQTGNKVNWVVLEENVLRQRVTTDIATGGGQFDVITIGSYEAPIWGKQNWLVPMNDLPASYDYEDIFPAIRDALSANGKMYALPFYAESSFTFYRKDLFAAAGLTMPEKPTYAQIHDFAAKLTDKSKEQYGICLRGKAGWGENMAYLDTVVNTMGGRWFDEKWQPQLTSPEWTKSVEFYVDLLKNYGPPGAVGNGFNENLALFTTGHCAMWIDATSAAGFVYNKSGSQVWDKAGIAAAPTGTVPNGAGWFWAWSLAVPKTSKQVDAAKQFIGWSTSKEYIKLAGSTQGWTVTPPGTRKSTYDNADYIKAAPFAMTVKTAILSADVAHPTSMAVPYTGIQYVAIPEFQALGTQMGQLVAGALAGQNTVADALKQGQAAALTAMQQGGYIQ